MTSSEFKGHAIKSSQVYYRYLDENGKGVVKTAVRSIRRRPGSDLFDLQLRTKLATGLDGTDLEYEFCAKRYTSHEVKPYKISDDRSVLTVRPMASLMDAFAALTPDDLTLISDLKFLVKRVETWYQNFGDAITLCERVQNIPPAIFPKKSTPSMEQQRAIDGALSHPLSYIWGAPGTGKTRCVLTSCVLSHLFESDKSRLLLLAPTNNAVEQMLNGILPALVEAGIKKTSTLRLGTPSAEFAARYPECCENMSLEHSLSELESQKSVLEKCLRYRNFLLLFSNAVSDISELFSLLITARQTEKRCIDAVQSLRRDAAVSQGKLLFVKEDVKNLLHEISAQEKVINSFTFQIKSILFPFSAQKYTRQLEQDKSALQQKLAEVDQLNEILKSAEQEEAVLVIQQDKAFSDIQEYTREILSTSEFWPSFQKEVFWLSTADESVACLEKYAGVVEEFKKQLQDRGAPYLTFSNLTEQDLSQKLSAIQNKIDALQGSSVESRLNKVRVLAATIDRFIASASPDGFGSFFPDRIFVDEAGYTPLIKIMPIFSLNVPVTLTGDHMQLPPICEMEDTAFEREGQETVFLWAQSALHAEHIFDCNFHQLLSAYLLSKTPQFKTMQKYDLTATYRFGAALADLLASYVYAPTFHSALPCGTKIYTLHAPNILGSKRRTSPTEANVLKQLLTAYDVPDYAILTPYRNQVSLLSSLLPTVAADGRILTVHASQGREWDVLFLSVVDTNNKWFTDTTRSITKGKMVINTAVSRARKNLVIVCDADYWKDQPDQLIGRLVLASQPLADASVLNP